MTASAQFEPVNNAYSGADAAPQQAHSEAIGTVSAQNAGSRASADLQASSGGITTGAHVGALDGVRGMAILLVLLFHYGNSAKDFGFTAAPIRALGIGWMGVDLFFALSGFLITGILWDSKDKAHYFRNFYARRSLRIFPLYYLALFSVIAMQMVWPQAGIYGTESPVYIALYATNFLAALSGTETVGVLTHFWSLAIEEHFYLVWPLVVFLGTRRQVMGVAIVMIVAAVLCRTYLVQADNTIAAYMLTPARMDALAVGAFFSLAIRGPGGLAALVRPAWILAGICIPVLGLLLATSGTIAESSPHMQTVGYTVFSLLCAAGIIIGMTFAPLNGLLSLPPLRWLGKYSYGLYVWHPIINTVLFYTSARALFGPPNTLNSAALLGLGVVLTLAVSWLSYNLWEKQFLRLKVRFPTAEKS